MLRKSELYCSDSSPTKSGLFFLVKEILVGDFSEYFVKTQGVSDRSIKFQSSFAFARVLIEVMRTHKKTGEALPSFWYAPRLSQEFFLVD